MGWGRSVVRKVLKYYQRNNRETSDTLYSSVGAKQIKNITASPQAEHRGGRWGAKARKGEIRGRIKWSVVAVLRILLNGMLQE